MLRLSITISDATPIGQISTVACRAVMQRTDPGCCSAGMKYGGRRANGWTARVGRSTLASMTRRPVLLLVACSLLLTLMSPLRRAEAQDWAKAALDKSPRHREYVAIQAGGRVVNTFVVYPEVPTTAPVIVMIHEIFGLSDWAKLMADELAAKGYIVLAPDLLSGSGPGIVSPESAAAGSDSSAHADHMSGMAHGSTMGSGSATSGTDSYKSMDEITKAVSGLPPAQVMSDLDAVANFGVKLPSANGTLFVAGFCWGGGKTFAFATHHKGLAAAFVFYGPPPPASALTTISAPVYGFYAGNDARIGATVPDTITAMKAAGKSYEPVTYAGAGHGFMRAGQAPDATPENRKAYDEGLARMLLHLQTGK